MKKLILFLIFLFAFCFTSLAFAGEIELAWDANSEPDLDGYKIYWGTATGNYSYSVAVGNVTQYILNDPGLIEGTTYFFAATAYDTDGNESGYSNEVSHKINNSSPSDPLNLEVVSKSVQINVIVNIP